MNNRIKLCPTDMAVILALLLVGSFHEQISCLLSVVLSVFLLLYLGEKGSLRIKYDINAWSVLLICIGYGLSCFWAVDSGMALIGFFKLLPLGLFALTMWQDHEEQKVLQILPYFAAVVAVVSAIGMQIPACSRWFSVAGRLSGFFQYPNTFAIFLLVCQLLLLKKDRKPWWDYVTMLVLLAGLLYTGSRAVFVLCLISNFAMLIVLFGKKGRQLLLAGAVVAVLIVVVLALGGNPVIRRYLTISLTESTFVGRILYLVDALPLLLKYPFGMGYMGYYYTQTSIQTGVYAVAYIHNDFMQLLLDIGWIPGGVFIGAVVAYFLRKGVPLADKIITAALCLHCLFDFNLQMLGMFFLLLILLDRQDAPVKIVKTRKFVTTALILAVAVNLYMGTALTLSHMKKYEAADAMYPYNTRNKLSMLSQEKDLEKANAIADEILRQNTAYFAPYSIKAKYSYAKGDFTSLIQYKRAVFEKNPFDHTEYADYCKMLLSGIELYQKAGDKRSAEFCASELKNTLERLEGNKQRLSSLGKMINDQPVTELPAELLQQVRQVLDNLD